MKYLLDTDTLIFWLKGNKKVEEMALSVGLVKLGYAVVSQAELYFGAYNSEQIEKNLNAIEIVKQKLALVAFDANNVKHFELKAGQNSCCK